METESLSAINAFVQAHEEISDQDLLRLRSLSSRERSDLIVSACETAAAIYRSRLAAGLPGVEPAPWPRSTWEFLRKNATHG